MLSAPRSTVAAEHALPQRPHPPQQRRRSPATGWPRRARLRPTPARGACDARAGRGGARPSESARTGHTTKTSAASPVDHPDDAPQDERQENAAERPRPSRAQAADTRGPWPASATANRTRTRPCRSPERSAAAPIPSPPQGGAGEARGPARTPAPGCPRASPAPGAPARGSGRRPGYAGRYRRRTAPTPSMNSRGPPAGPRRELVTGSPGSGAEPPAGPASRGEGGPVQEVWPTIAMSTAAENGRSNTAAPNDGASPAAAPRRSQRRTAHSSTASIRNRPHSSWRGALGGIAQEQGDALPPAGGDRRGRGGSPRATHPTSGGSRVGGWSRSRSPSAPRVAARRPPAPGRSAAGHLSGDAALEIEHDGALGLSGVRADSIATQHLGDLPEHRAPAACAARAGVLALGPRPWRFARRVRASCS